MRKPWKRWTWKQRAAYAAGLTPVSLVLLILNTTAEGVVAKLVVAGLILLILAPAGYVLFSAVFAAERRHEEGDETAYSPRVRRILREREDKRHGDG